MHACGRAYARMHVCVRAGVRGETLGIARLRVVD
jgi:hypothetical protein